MGYESKEPKESINFEKTNILQKCPFKHVKKECGHHPYLTKDEQGWYIVQCTCGARGPFTPRGMEIEAWNRSSINEKLDDLLFTWEKCQMLFENIGKTDAANSIRACHDQLKELIDK